MILEDSENAGAWSALGSMLYNGDCAGYTVPSEPPAEQVEELEASNNRFMEGYYKMKKKYDDGE